MNFASPQFWTILISCFLASRIVIALARKFSPSYEQDAGKVCLLATGLILLGSESLLTLCVFLWVVGLSWLGVILAGRNLFSKHTIPGVLIFLVLLLGQLAPLFYYKYWNFVLNEWLGLNLQKPSVLIPMGLSFYTFQKIGFWIDTIRNPASRPRLLDYLNFCSFFPQIVAGPIERRNDLLPQIEETRFRLDLKALDKALRWIVLGLAYKLIVADNLGNLSGLLHIDPHNAWQVWFECLVFALRIYFDFAGYSFIAVGLGLLFGVRLTLNFLSPYWSKDMREFWRRWHVSLGSWLRDYIYLPLGGRKRRWILNTLIVFGVSGIWHGAGWGFLVWGLMHGVGVAFCGIGKPWPLPAAIKRATTFAYAIAAWLFFFERDVTMLKQKAFSMLNPMAYLPDKAKALPAVFGSPSDAVTIGLVIVLAFAALALEGLEFRKKHLDPQPYRLLRSNAMIILLAALTVWLAPMEESSFIYFNF